MVRELGACEKVSVLMALEKGLKGSRYDKEKP